MELLEKLFKETLELKQSYINRVKDWSKKNYEINNERQKWRNKEWLNFLGIEPVYVEVKTNNGEYVNSACFPKGFHNTENAIKLNNLQRDVRRIAGKNEEDYINHEIKEAIRYYEKSIMKLNERLKDYNIDVNNIVLNSSYVKENIETIIYDGKIKIRAHTIIASGEVQKPHYRYLIKKIK
jgi:hypothetical protein